MHIRDLSRPCDSNHQSTLQLPTLILVAHFVHDTYPSNFKTMPGGCGEVDHLCSKLAPHLLETDLSFSKAVGKLVIRFLL